MPFLSPPPINNQIWQDDCAQGGVKIVSLMDLNFTTVVAKQPTVLQDLDGKILG